MSWRSRWVIVPTVLILVVLGWNVYVATHDGGLVAGRVVDATGHPVPQATVVLYARSFLTNDERARVETDADGHFRFTSNRDHALQVQAQAPDKGKSARIRVRLLFRGENVKLGRPLVLEP